jgi:hypothetical protein
LTSETPSIGPVALRSALRRLLGVPETRCDLEPEKRGRVELDRVVVEKWVLTAEPGSRIPLTLYRPREVEGRLPAVVLTCGHGDSKGVAHMTYVAQTYARIGVACLLADPLGEEERNAEGEIRTRAHDAPDVAYRAELAGRSVMGKFVFDSMRGFDLLESLDWIDPHRLGVIGNSLGGAVAGWLFALEPRLRMTVISGWGFSDSLCARGKHCTRVPNQKLRAICGWDQYLRLGAEHGALLVMNGDSDTVIDSDGSGVVWRDTEANLGSADPGQERLGAWFCPGGGHRPYQGYKDALLFSERQLGPPGLGSGAIEALPELNFGEWCDRHDIELEDLYGTELHYRGATLPDLELRPVPRQRLAVLEDDEVGGPDFTIDGWLETVG